MNVEFLPPARQELQDAFEWYEGQLPSLGWEFLSEVDEAVRRVAAWPESSGKLTKSLRRCLIRRFPYGLIYGVETGSIVIVAVAHLHRKPFYWTNRSRKS